MGLAAAAFAMCSLTLVGSVAVERTVATGIVVASSIVVEAPDIAPTVAAAIMAAESVDEVVPEPPVEVEVEAPVAPVVASAPTSRRTAEPKPAAPAVVNPLRAAPAPSGQQMASLDLDYQQDLFDDRKGLFRKRSRRGKHR